MRLASSAAEVAIIGGAQLFGPALPLADILYLTEIHADNSGDTRFPCWNRSEWREVEREDHAGTADGTPAYSFLTLQRIR